MVENNYEQGIVIANLLIERQIEDADRWRYEWLILANIGVVSLVSVDAVWNASVDVLTLLGIVTLAATGVRLSRFEKHRIRFLVDLYYKFGHPPAFWPRRWRF